MSQETTSSKQALRTKRAGEAVTRTALEAEIDTQVWHLYGPARNP